MAMDAVFVHPPCDDIAKIRQAIRTSGTSHYVYVLCRPNGQPFYVGKGTGNRLLMHELSAVHTSDRSHKLNLIRSLHRAEAKVHYGVYCFCADEKAAHHHERELIARIGRHDLGRGPLTNQTDGGEGTSNPSAASLARRAASLGGAADDPDRRRINEFVVHISGPISSIPIKPMGARTLRFTSPHPSPRRPTERMARAIAAITLATRQALAPGITLPRQFRLEEVFYVLENGAARDMLKAGLLKLASKPNTPDQEKFTLNRRGYQETIRFIGTPRLLDLGLIDP